MQTQNVHLTCNKKQGVGVMELKEGHFGTKMMHGCTMV